MSEDIQRALGRLEGQMGHVITELQAIQDKVDVIGNRPCRNAQRIADVEGKVLVSKGWIMGAAAAGGLFVTFSKYALDQLLKKAGG